MKVILGLGSGRCGTVSLTRLLNDQAEVIAEHENVGLWWDVNTVLFKDAWKKITTAEPSSPVVASVSFAWLKYVPMAIEHDPTVRCICLKRDRGETVESFSQHMWRFNVWTHHLSPHFDPDKYARSMAQYVGFPKFDAPREKAIGMYWDEYYRVAEEHERRYPEHFKIFWIDSFNSYDGVFSMLDFAGIENKTINIGVKMNERGMQEAA